MKRLVSAICVALLGGLLFWGAQKDVVATAPGGMDEALSDMWMAEEARLSVLDYELSEYVKLCDYSQLSVDVNYVKVDDEYVINAINQTLQSYPGYEETDKQTVEDGDLVNIDYVGTVDGEEFDGGSAKGSHLSIGSGQFIDGFEDGLVGASVGDKVTLNLTFPEDYEESLAGKDVVFVVTVNSIDEEVFYTYEELSDDFVSDNFGYETVEDFYDYVKSYYKDSMESTKQSDARTALVQKLVQECEVTVPEELLINRSKEYLASFRESVEQAGLSVTDYLQNNYGYGPSEFEEQILSMMNESLCQQMVLAAISQQEGIEADEEGLEEYINAYVSYYGFQDKEELFAEYPEQELTLAYVCNSVVDKLLDTCEVNYIPTSE
ncbi:MAG: trigger factor [Lachnospiraceae bacterium]